MPTIGKGNLLALFFDLAGFLCALSFPFVARVARCAPFFAVSFFSEIFFFGDLILPVFVRFTLLIWAMVVSLSGMERKGKKILRGGIFFNPLLHHFALRVYVSFAERVCAGLMSKLYYEFHVFDVANFCVVSSPGVSSDAAPLST